MRFQKINEDRGERDGFVCGCRAVEIILFLVAFLVNCLNGYFMQVN